MGKRQYFDYCRWVFCFLHRAHANSAWCKVNVFKVIVLLGTFALAMAFAGNDLVNFVGVPLAGFSSYTDFMANGNGVANDYLMGALNEPAKTPFIFLFLSGVIMVISLITSKKSPKCNQDFCRSFASG